jgi:glucose/arabinose dehydrogenase
VPLSAQYAGQDPFPVLTPGAIVPYDLSLRNAGDEPWKNGEPGHEVRLGVANDSAAPADLGMAVDWLSSNRVARPIAQEVLPGDVATFRFLIRAPEAVGTYRIALRPVIDGVSWLEDAGIYVDVFVVPDDGYHVAAMSPSSVVSVGPGATADVTVSVRNTGTQSFIKGSGAELVLGVVRDDPSFGTFGIGWLGPDRIARQEEDAVAPGAIATFRFTIQGAGSPGTTTRIALRPLIEGRRWLDADIDLSITILAPGGAPTLVPTIVQDGLTTPWEIAFTPDGRMVVTERDLADIKVFASGAKDAPLLERYLLGNVPGGQSAGVKGAVIDPAFAENGFMYVCSARSEPGPDGSLADAPAYMEVLRYRMDDESRITFDGYVLRYAIKYQDGLHSCRLKIGPDGKFWMTVGTSADDSSAPQDPHELVGKVIRFEKDGSVPADNPVLPGDVAPTLVYTFGHRNPQGLAFDPIDGRAIASEQGPERDDEINFLTAGGNYGWPLYAGRNAWPGTGDPQPDSMEAPAWASGPTTVALSGIGFVTGPQWGSWSGSLFGATLKDADLRRFVREGDRLIEQDVLLSGLFGRLRTVVQGPDGAIYVPTDNGPGSDVIIRIVPAPAN